MKTRKIVKFLYLGKLIDRAKVLRAQGQHNEAIKSLKRALSIYPRYATAWNNSGSILSDLDHHKEALKCYEKALAISPEYKIARKNKARAMKR